MPSQWLGELTNNLAKAQPDDVKAISIIDNIEEWAGDLRQTQKELLLLAVEKRSQFAFDLIRWITHVTKMLIVIAQSPACKQFPRDKIVEHADWLLSILSWIPRDDPQAVGFLETIGMTETLFQAAADAVSLNCREVLESARELLEKWAFSAGRHHVGWSILERSLLALAILALSQPTEEAADILHLKRAISIALDSPECPNHELRDKTARNLRDRAESPGSLGRRWSRIESAIQDIDRAKLRSLLVEIADLLFPATAGERVSRSRY